MKSGWWAKVIEAGGVGTAGWLWGNLKRRIGNGRETKFWDYPWAGSEPLKQVFPRLYRLSENRDASVGEMGKWVEGKWMWEMKWIRELREREEEVVNLLTSNISHFVPLAGCDDGWTWRASPDGKYSTQSAYAIIKSRRSESQLHELDEKVWMSIWKTRAPQKAVVTTWRMLRNRLPSCDNLRKRNIMLSDDEQKCKQCSYHSESINHLFNSCTKTQEVWDEIQKWTGIQMARPASPMMHWKMFSFCGKEKKVKGLLNSIWVGCVWLLWKKRNEKRFENKDWEVNELIMELKTRVWSWNKVFGMLDKDVEFTFWCSNDLISHVL